MWQHEPPLGPASGNTRQNLIVLPRPDTKLTYLEELDEYWRALPADRFPNIHAVVDALIDPEEDPEARFAFGLEMLVTGIAAQRGPRRS